MSQRLVMDVLQLKTVRERPFGTRIILDRHTRVRPHDMIYVPKTGTWTEVNEFQVGHQVGTHRAVCRTVRPVDSPPRPMHTYQCLTGEGSTLEPCDLIWCADRSNWVSPRPEFLGTPVSQFYGSVYRPIKELSVRPDICSMAASSEDRSIVHCAAVTTDNIVHCCGGAKGESL